MGRATCREKREQWWGLWGGCEKQHASYKKAVTTGRKVCDLEQAWEFKRRREDPDASCGSVEICTRSL